MPYASEKKAKQKSEENPDAIIGKTQHNEELRQRR